ncbi:hypothetical protein M408DRAFT_303860 [Serendipita vermifera MAFF 305830]|uniref:guanosine-diphosphatase n=1 Tax=Serendipita vermifera MAFF 305830 TaxID=933852 RepID=A0A0C2WUP9_SERVB|nr:hypothetical protein M408DRAFT_303860 [Serendipita vermifera MAFF 305830]
MRPTRPSILPRISAGQSPYTYAYESLNGGGGPMQNGWRAVWAWRRLLFGVSLGLLVVWMIFGGPWHRQDTTPDFEFEIPKQDWDTRPRPPSRPPPTTQPRPVLTFEADPNPSSTEQCTTAHVSADGKSKPLVQWALMIDAGSTGSRIHVYKFNNCLSSPTYEYEVFKMTRPGLSSFATNVQKAAESLDPLMQEAERVVPRALWKCTPVAVKATAGLRLLGATESDAILAAVKHRLQTTYKFPVVSKDGVVIMDGKDEGVYAWITANYLLNALPSGSAAPNTGSDDIVPYAVLDLGGASTQIVFKPSFDADGDGIDDPGKGLEDGEHKYDLHFGGKNHVLYQHSYLGYGLMRARAGVHRVVEFMGSYSSSTTPSPKKRPGRPDGGLSKGKHIGAGGVGASADDDEDDEDEDDWADPAREETIANPCIARGMEKRVEVDIGRAGTKVMRNVTMMGADIGSWNACNRVLELVMAKDAVCHVKPCSFNGVYQPSLLDTFPTGPTMLLSYFYDRIAPLLAPPAPAPIGSKEAVDPTEELVFPISLVKDLARVVCEGESAWKTHKFPFTSGASRGAPMRWGDSELVMEELRGRPEYCLDLSFMYALLRLGYEFGADRGVRIGKKVKGTELGWCLGATLGLVGDAGFECRA